MPQRVNVVRHRSAMHRLSSAVCVRRPLLSPSPMQGFNSPRVQHGSIRRALCIPPQQTPDSILRSKDWNDMPVSTRALWQTLGWDEHNWAHGPNPPSDYRDWEDLSYAEEVAASSLGYTEDTWDSESGNPNGFSSPWNPWNQYRVFFGVVGFLLACMKYEDYMQWKRVELSYEQQSELRELVTKLELPASPADREPARSWRTSWRQATPSQKEEVASKYLQHLLKVFHQLSGRQPYITRERWEQLEQGAHSGPYTSKHDSHAARAVCGTVFSKGGRGMRLCVTDRPTSADANGGLSFRAFATLCTLLASSTQVHPHGTPPPHPMGPHRARRLCNALHAARCSPRRRRAT